MKVIIMAGGKGTRFWPRSLDQMPKQFLALTSNLTMLQQTYKRFREWLPEHLIYVCTWRGYLDLVKEQLPDLTDSKIILEPEQRDTGPGIGLAALHFLRQGDDEVLVTAAADHHIPDSEQLMSVLMQAETFAGTGCPIVTIGVTPTRPETGYGYIMTSGTNDRDNVLKVQTFIEKPTMQKAQQLIQCADVYWNSGIVVWKPSTIQHYMMRYEMELWNVLNSSGDELDKGYSLLPHRSVDHAILEKSDNLYCIPARFEWDDVGTWKSLERMCHPDPQGNITFGDTHTFSTNNSIIFSEHQKAIVIGVEDLIIVSTADGLLVCHKSKELQIKKSVEGGGNKRALNINSSEMSCV
ncbi:mannose-1-phosphate guanylyltransferase [Cohnella kolymensis]|uniref:mannose-1-phosphate guanylyltransferase n=1 Tax=Cohnella kolymensis TaxID=1590652 RepID=UPI0006973F6E|nr:sugar phosphate nucleotidyltransferase [Cohnella kolymensis]